MSLILTPVVRIVNNLDNIYGMFSIPLCFYRTNSFLDIGIMLRLDGGGAHGDNKWITASSINKFYKLLP